LQRAIGHQLHALEDVVVIGGVGGLPGNLRGGDANHGGVSADAVLEGLLLCVICVVVLFDVVGFSHKFQEL
jgi:hypothetical protein